MVSDSKRQQKVLLDDVLIDIFCRLRVESLVPCMVVCKAWHRVITSPFFCKVHLNIQKTPSNTIKFILHEQDFVYTLLADHESIFNRTKNSKLYYTLGLFRRNYNYRTWQLRIHGICDGLLCVSDKDYRIGYDIHLWNPICRKIKKIPQLVISKEYDGFDMNCGVSFGYYDDDYKVIVISHVGHTYFVSIYSLRTNCWKIIPTIFNFDGFVSLQPTRFVNGTAYMVTYADSDSTLKQKHLVLVCFDLRDETSRQLKLPGEFLQHCTEFRIEAYGDTIALVGCNQICLGMWILRDKGSSKSPWERKFVIELEEVGHTHLVGFLCNGNYMVRTVFAEQNLIKYFLCHVDSPKFIESRSLDDEFPDILSCIDSNCVESLLLINENSLNPFVHTKMESSCSSVLFTLNKANASPIIARLNDESKKCRNCFG